MQYIELLLFFVLLFPATQNNTVIRPSGVNWLFNMFYIYFIILHWILQEQETHKTLV